MKRLVPVVVGSVMVLTAASVVAVASRSKRTRVLAAPIASAAPERALPQAPPAPQAELPPPARMEPAPGGTAPSRLSLTAEDHEPKDARQVLSADELSALRRATTDNPRDREKRFNLVRALMRSGDREAALTEAKAWRERDAYNLVVVRLLGDLYAEMGEREKAKRAYSAVVELLPEDPEAQRALATVLKQTGDLEGARDRLLAAVAHRGDDVRIAFELADIEQRLGRTHDAGERFRKIIADPSAREAVRYPAKQRLAQIDAATRREALARGDRKMAEGLEEEIQKLDVKGGIENDIKVYLSWDTDRTDVDLWVRTPSGEAVNYQHRTGKNGEALFDDVTTGYGPESFTAKHAQKGSYQVEVNYFGTQRQTFTEARGEVVVLLYEGTAAEKRFVLPYRMTKPKQTVRVATIEVTS